MCKFIKYVDASRGHTIYVNVRGISAVRYDAKEDVLTVTIGDPQGKCDVRSLSGREAQEALAIIDSCAKP